MAPAPAFGDSIAGCLLGGAVGDALGAVVEFDSIDEIRRRYGPDGLVAFPPEGGRITDDTQMTLFTAEALIRARRRFERSRVDYAVDELWWAYRRWLDTQGEPPAVNRETVTAATATVASSPSPPFGTAGRRATPACRPSPATSPAASSCRSTTPRGAAA